MFETRNPAKPGQVIASYSPHSPAEVSAALKVARTAQETWAEQNAADRERTLSAFVAALQGRAEDLAEAITLEQGKPLREARGEVAKSISESRFMAAQTLAPIGEVMPSARPGVRSWTMRRPRGVIAGITPWNFPVLTPLRKVMPALAFANAIVLKPSELTPKAALIIENCAKENLPGGLVQCVIGGVEVGRALIGDGEVDAISFTGSVEVGREIYRMAAGNLVEISLELGGKNPAIINDTGNLDGCLDQVFNAAMICAGQRCTSISRIIVAEPLAEAVIAGLVRRAEAAVVGDGMTDGVTIGPLISAAHRDKVAAYVTAAEKDGASLLTGGLPAAGQGLDDGYFYLPTVLSGVRPDSRLFQEEVFGPVLGVTTYDNLDDAFSLANGVRYGLSSSLFSERPEVVERFLAESQSGMLHVNHGTVPDSHMPFGGIKDSGVGAPSVGHGAAAFYTTEHAVYVMAKA
jgi:aldehyde dehydrogenase (NAD+)